MSRNDRTSTRRQNWYVRLSARLVFAAVLATLILLLAGSDRVNGSDQEIDKLYRFMQASNASDVAVQLFRLGRDHISKEEWKSAEGSFTDFISRYPADKNVDAALYWLAFALEKQNKLREADQALERLIRDYPQSNWVIDGRTKRIELAPRLNNNKAIESGIKEGNEEVKLAALQSLFDSRPDRAMKLALEIIKPDSGASNRMKEAAIILIADHGDPQAILIDVARNHSDPKLRRKAIQMLGEVKGNNVIEFLTELAIKSSDHETALEAARAIGEHEDARARTALLQIARTAADVQLRLRAIAELGGREDDTTGDELLKLFESEKNREIRLGIISALSDLETPRTRAKIVEIARMADDIELRRSAIEAIGEREDETAADALIQLYDAEKDEEMKEEIVEALGETNQKRALRKLMEIVKSGASARLKKKAMSALGDSDDPEASRFLEDLLKKNN
jgi:HEAT repeat protein